MEEIKLEISLLDENSKNYVSNEIRKWAISVTNRSIDYLKLKEVDTIEDTSYLDNLVERLAYAVDNDTTYTHNYIPPMLNYPDGRKYEKLTDEEFYEMLK